MSVSVYEPTGIIHKTTVDIGNIRNIPETVKITQYDDSFTDTSSLPIIAVKLVNGGTVYKIPETANVSIRVGKKDGTSVYNPCLGVSSDYSTAYFAVTQQMSAVEGRQNAVVEVVTTDGLSGTGVFTIDVQKNPISEESVFSENEMKTFDQIANEANKAAASIGRFETDLSNTMEQSQKAEETANNALNIASDAKQTAETTDARLSSIIANGQQTEGNTELIYIRTGYDGHKYATAGDAVRTQSKNSELISTNTLAKIYFHKYLQGFSLGDSSLSFIYDDNFTTVVYPLEKRSFIDGNISYPFNPSLGKKAQVVTLDKNFLAVSNTAADVENNTAEIQISKFSQLSDRVKYIAITTSGNLYDIKFYHVFSNDSLVVDQPDLSPYLTENDISTPFLVAFSRNKYLAGYNTETKDVSLYDVEGFTTLIYSVDINSKNGYIEYPFNSGTRIPQTVALDSNLKAVSNLAATLTDKKAKLNVKDYNRRSETKYIAISTDGDIKEINFSGFFNIDMFNSEKTYPVADFNPPYLYSNETELWIYNQTLFNKIINPYDFNSWYVTNLIVQDARKQISIPGISAPQKTQVTIADGKTVLFIGDSYTAAGIYPKFVYDTIESLGKHVTLIGTKGSDNYKNEGHSGWRAYTYTNCAVGSDDIEALSGTNPFWNPETSKFDFSYYINNNSFSTPDIVFINLGTNDYARGNHDSDEEIVGYLTEMIDSIKEFNSNIRVVLWLPALLPIGINSDYRRWSGVIKYSNLVIENNLGDERCPVRYCFSPSEDGQIEERMINGHTYKILKDVTHPSDIGYQHIGQMIIPYIHD